MATKLFPLLPVDPVVDRRAAGSLRRLGIDAIDLYQVHWPNPVVPGHGDHVGAWPSSAREGLVRHVGVSNFSLAHWQEAERAWAGRSCRTR